MASKSIQEELLALYEAHNGLLRPEDVVEFAKNPETALHSRFEWDDSAAAHQWRLEQARNVIRVHVTTVANNEVRMWVSLDTDRYSTSGYRSLEDVMTDEKRREMFIKQAARDFRIFRAKYQMLKELAPLFEIAEQVL